MKIVITVFNIAFCCAIYGQSNPLEFIKTRPSFKTKTVSGSKKDSLFVIKNKPNINLNIYKQYKSWPEKELMDRYTESVFFYTDEDSEHTYYTLQWIDPIVIYIDESYAVEVKLKLTEFIKQLNSIKNLDISITNNIDNANYYIKKSDKTFDNKFYNFTNRDIKSNFVFNNANYNIIKGGNNHIKGCSLEINTNNISSNSKITNVLNHALLLSLGRFFILPDYDNSNSFLSKNYIGSSTISDFDLQILKIHYNYIFNYPIQSSIFRELLKL